MYHYNAFISYNHNPRDTKIARRLQQKLERYRLPKDIRSSSGVSNIERVFLDKGELEVAGDLNKVIMDALENSDYLIVICSPESKSSIWVQREIEFFLRNHSLDNILTVISAGEPFDVLPELLLYEDIPDQNDGNVKRVFREPLSCDYRLAEKEADKIELPRLVAALIGCRYDDLVQRRKQYVQQIKTRIAVGLSAVMMVASAYVLWSSHQVKVNYENSLREQSANLAVQSEQALNSGDRLKAIRYALDALPSQDLKRPVVSQAVYALSEALDLYKTSENEKWSAVKQYSYDSGHLDMLPFSLGDKDYFAELGYDGQVRLWDANSNEEIMSEYFEELHQSGEDIKEIFFSNDNSLILAGSSRLLAVDIESEKEKYDKPYHLISDPEAVISFPYLSDKIICFNDSFLWVHVYYSGQSRLLKIDIKTGEVSDEIKIDIDSIPDKLTISPGGGHIAALYEKSDADIIEVYDSDSGKQIFSSSFSDRSACDILFSSDNDLIASGYTERPNITDYSLMPDVNIIGSGSSMFFQISKSRTAYICCYDIQSGSTNWQIEQKNVYSGEPWLVCEESDGQFKNCIICTIGSNAVICSPAGENLLQFDFRSKVIGYYHKPDRIRAVLSDGSIAWYDADHDEFRSIYNVFSSPVLDMKYDSDSPDSRLYIATTDNDLYLNTSRIIQYEFNGIDPKWQEYETLTVPDGTTFSPEAVESYKDSFIEILSLNYTGGDDEAFAHLTRRQTADGTVLLDQDIQLNGVSSYDSYKYSGIDKDLGIIYFTNIGHFSSPGLICVSLDDGSASKIDLKLSDDSDLSSDYSLIDPSGSFSCGIYGYKNGTLYYPAIQNAPSSDLSEQKKLVLLTADTSSGQVSRHEICALDDDQHYETNWLIDLNVTTEKILVFNSSNQFECYDFNGNLKWKTGAVSYFPAAVMLDDDDSILSAYDKRSSGCTLYVYEQQTIEDAHKIELGYINSDGPSSMEITELNDGSELLILKENNGFVISSGDESPMHRIIGVFQTYDLELNEFVLGDSFSREYGHVPYRALEDMIKEGNEALLY